MGKSNAVGSLIVLVVLIGSCLIGFFSRLFAVIRYESIIHEMDPWFNYRATKKYVEMGAQNFINWFDSTAWYPLGRAVGPTVYPGLMYTAGTIHAILNGLGFTTDIQDVCVFTSPIFSMFSSTATFLLTQEVWNTKAGLVAAVFMSIIPGYTQRSVAGSFDNEGVAIFALQISFYCWLRAVRTGAVFWGVATAFCYWYMTSAWGGYVLIINMIALHTFFILLTGRYSEKVYSAYTSFYCIGQMMAMCIHFVNTQPVTTSEHMSAFGVFGLIQLFAFHSRLTKTVGEEGSRRFFQFVVVVILALGTVGLVLAVRLGYVAPFTGRFYSMYDTGYARKHIPIISSVSEHQPTGWERYPMDVHLLPVFAFAGIWYIFQNLNAQNLFLIVNGVCSCYFSGIMTRLMLTVAPIISVLAGIGFSVSIERLLLKLPPPEIPAPEVTEKETSAVEDGDEADEDEIKEEKDEEKEEEKAATDRFGFLRNHPLPLKLLILATFGGFGSHYVHHSSMFTSLAYSSPSIMKYVKGPRGNQLLMDDWRESYYWLRQNTKEDAVIASWWDYGYQIAGFSNRTTVVDNNTWNNTHIAQVGRILASPEAKAWRLAKELDIDYFLIFFGGINGHSGDDINKFMWMIRIAQGVFPEDVKEKDFISNRGRYSPGKDDLTPTFRDSLMYKLSYHEFGTKHKVRNQKGEVYGYDQVRRVEIGHKNFNLKYFEEVYTTSKGLVRLYRLKTREELFGGFADTKKAIKTRRSKKIKKIKATTAQKLVQGKRTRAQAQFQL